MFPARTRRTRRAFMEVDVPGDVGGDLARSILPDLERIAKRWDRFITVVDAPADDAGERPGDYLSAPDLESAEKGLSDLNQLIDRVKVGVGIIPTRPAPIS